VIDLPEVEVDIIVSEWMGYFLIYENMLSSVMAAKDRFLKADGIMIPGAATIFLSAYCDTANKEAKAALKFQNKPITNTFDYILNPDHLMSKGVNIFHYDLNANNQYKPTFESDFSLNITSTGYCGGFIGWFNA
jgi:hypothetical protein